MTDDRFERRVAGWLGDGPETAPRRLMAVALEHAATHPRSRRATLVRRLRLRAAPLATAAAVIIVAGGAFVVLPWLRQPGPSAAATAVSGTEQCEARVRGVEVSTTEQGQRRLEGRIDACREDATDARVSGELTRKVTADLFDPDQELPDGSSNQYGTAELPADGGTWTGAFVATYTGMADPVEGRLTWILLGNGRYEGLVYRATTVLSRAGPASLSGIIEPIGDDAIVASTWCFVTSPDPATIDFGAAHIDLGRTCTITSGDPRLAGTASERRVIDTRAGGATSASGMLDVTTAGGGWTGAFTGTGSWFVPGLVTGRLLGTGGHAGQELVVTIASEDGMHGVLVGAVAPVP